jgi:PAS domain S-box-containing protein
MNEPGTTDSERSWETGEGGEERWQFALEGSDLGVWDWHPKTGDVYFSERWITMLGYRPEDIQPRLKEWSDRVHPEDLERVLSLIGEHMEGRTAVYESEHRLQAKDGSWRWIQDRGKVLRRDEEGKPLRMVGTHLDITERKQEEARLRRRTRQQEALGRLGREALAGGALEEVFHTATMLVAESLEVEYCKVLQRDAEGRRLRLVAGVGWNEGCVGVAAVEVDERTQAGYTLGQRDPVVMEDVAQETRFRLPRLLEEHGVRSGISMVMEWRGRVWGLLGAHGLAPREYTEDDRHFIQSVATLLSVVIERTAAEEALRAGDRRMREAQRIARLGDWEVDLRTGVLCWSEEVYRIFGVEAGEFGGTYEAFLEHVHPDDRERMRAEREKVFQGADGFEVEHRVVGAGGRMIWVRERAEVVREPGGQVVGLAGTVLDITDRKELLSQFLRAQRMESVGTLAAGMAHDLNNVLAPILMSVELLAMDEEEEGRKDMLRNIEKSARRGAALVAQVLSFARGLEGRKVEVRLSQVVGDVMKIVSETFPRNIQAQSVVEDGLWVVHADPTHLHQVLLNLCVNARDAMPEGGKLVVRAANVRLGERDRELHLDAQEGPYLRVEVEDTGEGMIPEVVEKIFDPFFTTKEIGKGTGLGLSTALSIVKGHGGFLRVTSEPGKGSLFQMYLPALAREATAEVAARRMGLRKGRGEMVLVVDDEPMIRRVTQLTLESFGYRVVVGADGAEGLSVYQAHRGEVRVVVTDMMMPVMDGPAMVGALRRLDPGLRIIATSGVAEGGREWRSAELGIHQVLTKPFTTEALLASIRRALEGEGHGGG